MRVRFSRDLADQNAPVFAAFRERPGQPLNVRVAPQISRKRQGTRLSTRYETWTDVVWTVACDTIAEAFDLREALRQFFAAVEELGAAGVVRGLQQVRRDHHSEMRQQAQSDDDSDQAIT